MKAVRDNAGGPMIVGPLQGPPPKVKQILFYGSNQPALNKAISDWIAKEQEDLSRIQQPFQIVNTSITLCKTYDKAMPDGSFEPVVYHFIQYLYV